ncbi:MAG: glycosyltransferase [Raoultibacter sp.]|jgi:glycosyltransferase involved in cell wall biosynthesis
MTKLVSVIMSLYKPNELFLAKQLDSINAQDYANIEVVIRNDYPEDINREEFIREHLTNFPFRYYHGNENLGYVKSFEELVLLAQGEYIAFSDQDDLWLPNRIGDGILPLIDGSVLSSCDRSIIDQDDKIILASWKESHPNAPETNWKTGDAITQRAAFTCYSIGMATIVKAEVAKAATPFPVDTGHDLWVTLYASEIGTCAFIDKALVQYRRHGDNITGLFSGISSKNDWYSERIEPRFRVSQEFLKRFPASENSKIINDFSQARVNRDRKALRQYRELAPMLVRFEILQSLVPDSIFKLLIKAGKRFAE